MGSVKDLNIQSEPTETELGLGTFVFSDRYSVFDWGEMPDLIPKKGEVLTTMGGYNFELLEQKGVKTHYRGLVGNEGLLKTEKITSPTNRMAINLAHIPEVESDGGQYRYEELSGRENFLIPLEVVFRNYLPVGSSFRRRYEPNDIGLDCCQWPKQEVELERPIVEFSTKLERQDRYLPKPEAQKLSGLTEAQFDDLSKIARRVNRHLNEHARKRNFKHLDGKIECIYDHGTIAVADVVGTFDENRFSYLGSQISKEILRQWYRTKDSGWYEKVVSAKRKSRGDYSGDWTSLVDRKPKPLDPKLQKLVAELYKAGANEWMRKDIFPAQKLSQVLEEMDKWRTKENL